MSNFDIDATELRLFMEDLCCDVCRFGHMEDGVAPDQVHIRQDVDLKLSDCYADIRITVPGQPAYFVEVKLNRDADDIVDQIARKYGQLTPVSEKAGKVIVVLSALDGDPAAFEARLRARIHPNLALELWYPPSLRDKLRRYFQLEVVQFERDELLRMRAAVGRIKGGFAFGAQYTGSTVESMLMWHFGCWTIQGLRKAAGPDNDGGAEAILKTGLFQDVAIVVVDLSGFSAYVRDTRDDSVVQAVLTSFYTKARRAVINCGGMLSQFVGDAVIAAFGVPARSPDYIEHALDCAVAIMDIGKSVSHNWQRHIDRIQTVKGCHTGIALGDMLVVPHRPYSRSHMGIVSDSVNMAARLSGFALPGEIVVSNAFYQASCRTRRGSFEEMQPLDAKNVGRLQAWKWKADGASGGLPEINDNKDNK
jgi:class 3 adenylate cyclase